MHLIVIGIIWAGLVMAENGTAIADTVETLQRSEDSLHEVKKHKKSLEKTIKEMKNNFLSLQKKSILFAARSRLHEKNLLKLRAKQSDLNNRMNKARYQFLNKKVQMTSIIAILQRVARKPPAALILSPQSPLTHLRTALLIGNTYPTLERQARDLKDNLRRSIRLKTKLDLTERNLNLKKHNLDEERKLLLEILNRKAIVAEKLLARKKIATARTKELSRKARSLRDLIAALSNERIARNKQKGQKYNQHLKNSKVSIIGNFYGKRPISGMPVVGNIIAPFGKSGGPGQPAEGLSLRTTPGSFVVAPRSGRVVFSGKFSGLGELLILEYGNEHHLLLAGMDRIDVKNGASVMAGEPIGIMSQLKDSNPILYVELRQNGKPINAIPWLTSRNNREN